MKDCCKPNKKKSMLGKVWGWLIGIVIGVILIAAVVQALINGMG